MFPNLPRPFLSTMPLLSVQGEHSGRTLCNLADGRTLPATVGLLKIACHPCALRGSTHKYESRTARILTYDLKIALPAEPLKPSRAHRPVNGKLPSLREVLIVMSRFVCLTTVMESRRRSRTASSIPSTLRNRRVLGWDRSDIGQTTRAVRVSSCTYLRCRVANS